MIQECKKDRNMEQKTEMNKNIDKKLTIYDIAKIAGVSPATVSRVIHKADYVRETTSRKVWDAFKAAGITPEMLSFKATGAKKTDGPRPKVPVILAYMQALNNPFYIDVLDGIQSYIKDRGCKMVVYSAPLDNYHMDEFLEFTASLQISGLITAARLSEDILRRLTAQYPLVQCSEYNPVCQNIPYVNVDDYTATKKAVAYLASANCQRIGFFSAPQNFTFVRNRYQAYKAALREAGLREYPQYTMTVADFSYERILAAAGTYFDLPIFPDGIFAVSDEHAHALVKAAMSKGIKIPDDLKIIGFDDTMYATLSTPAITTIAQPRQQLGSESARLLLEMIQNPAAAPAPVTLPTNILWRETT